MSNATNATNATAATDAFPMRPTLELLALLRGARSILLTTHGGPDGDGLGCIAALGEALEANGVRVLRLLPDPLPSKYAFLDPQKQFRSWADGGEAARATAWDVALVVDTHQSHLLRDVGEWLRSTSIPTAYLDHHPLDRARDDVYGTCDAVATGVLVFELLQALGLPISPAVAEAIYISISFDTNSFKYIRSAPESLEVGAQLIRLGVDTTRVYRNLFASNPLRKARVLGWVLTSVQFTCDGRLAYILVPHHLVDELKLERDDLRDSVNHILEIEGVEVAAALKEMEPGRAQISLRSKGTFLINGVAAAFGGGGHTLAAGCEIEAELSDAWTRLEIPLRRVLEGAST